MLLPSTQLELVRLGISLYGQWPSKEARLIMASKNGTLYEMSQKQVNGSKAQDEFGTSQFKHNYAADFLEPALTYKAIVAQVKTIESGSCVSYGCTFTCHRTTTIALLPIGYADGLNRLLSNKGEVLIRGYRAPIIGRVCMNLCMVDVTDIPGVKPDDEAVIIGTQDSQTISAEEVADKLGTINYEVLTSLPMHIPRFYLGRKPIDRNED
ncbi:MAG: hypothetical protein K6A35_04015 [bacterium]|nr:hypothetical protein [bacterium]